AVERRPELRSLKDVNRRVDFAQLEFLGRCVPSFDDLAESAVCISHDAAVRAYVVRLEGENGRRGTLSSMRLDEIVQHRRAEQGRVAREDEHVTGHAGKVRTRGAQRVA